MQQQAPAVQQPAPAMQQPQGPAVQQPAQRDKNRIRRPQDDQQQDDQ
jgi:hypothetical protein